MQLNTLKTTPGNRSCFFIVASSDEANMSAITAKTVFLILEKEAKIRIERQPFL